MYISHSKLNSWNRCRKQFDYAYNKNWEPKQKKEYLQTGTEVHSLLEKFYKTGDLDIQKEIESRMYELDEDNLKAFQLAIMVCKRYIEDYAPLADRDWEILEVEYNFQVPFTTPSGNEFVLEGYVDIIARDKKWGKIWVWDHKTGSRMLTEQQVLMDAQTPTYAAAIRDKLGYDVHGLMFNLINTYDYKHHLEVATEKLFKRIQTYRTPIEMDNFLQELYRQVDDIVENKNRIYRNLSRDCSGCFFFNPCLMGMKGGDENDILEIEYQQRKPRPGREVTSGTGERNLPPY